MKRFLDWLNAPAKINNYTMSLILLWLCTIWILLIVIVFSGCSKSPYPHGRGIPEHKVNNIRYAYVAEIGDRPFVVYAHGGISEEFYNCMIPERKVSLPKAICTDLVRIE